MKKTLGSVFILLICIPLVGCNLNDLSVMEGYVVKKRNDSILVNEVWFSNAPTDVQVGQKVRVWYDIIAESYPGQSSAKKVVIQENAKPRHASLHEDEAIRKALDKVPENVIPVIESLNYNEMSDIWDIQINDTKIQVDDK